MTTTVFVNGATLTDAAWFNDVNGVAYNILGNGTIVPASAAAARTNLGAASLAANTFTGAQNTARASVTAAATTADIWGAAGNEIDWQGTTTCTGFPAAPQAGASRALICAAAAPFTAGANMLIDGMASGATYTCAANDIVTVHAISTTQFRLVIQPYSAIPIGSGFKAISFTRDISLASGTQAVTGVGFKPRGIMFLSGTSAGTANIGSWGIDDGTTHLCNIWFNASSANGFATSGAASIYANPVAGSAYQGAVQSFDSDGFTINWAKTGTPTGTLTVQALCFR